MTESTFAHIDADGDGKISFEEFISAAVDKLALLYINASIIASFALLVPP